MAKSYFEKLKDPRWQKKRLEVMQRDNFTCKECGAKDMTLSVHHGYYTGGKEPWDYSIDTLHTVCQLCHEKYEDIKHDVHLELGKLSIKEMKNVFSFLIEDNRNALFLEQIKDKLPDIMVDLYEKIIALASGSQSKTITLPSIDKLNEALTDTGDLIEEDRVSINEWVKENKPNRKELAKHLEWYPYLTISQIQTCFTMANLPYEDFILNNKTEVENG